MDHSSTTGLKLLLNLLLLVTVNIVCQEGNPTTGGHSLHCVNDYLFTVNCTMSLPPSENTSDNNGSYWLVFTETYEKKTFVCLLTNTDGDYFCSVETSRPLPDDNDDYSEIFSDTDTYEISLYHNQTGGYDVCEVLDGEYTPFTNIKPNAPCCLTVSHNSNQHHFTWKSTYEKYTFDTKLVDSFEYQLNFFKRGDSLHSSDRVISHSINTDRTNFSVDDETFTPDTDFAARVRTSPNMAFFKGQWSDWSCEVHWKTDSALTTDLSSNTFAPELKVFIPLTVVVLLLLIFCYVPVRKWKQHGFIPTPEPYFHTLYSDCQGDFKRWVITHEAAADALKAETSLRIDTLTKCTDNPPQLVTAEDSRYSNISINPVSAESVLGDRYNGTTTTPVSAPEGLTLGSKPGSPAEGDSGCWLSSDTSLEKSSPWHRNEYCTLIAFKQSGSYAAEHQRASSTKSCYK